MKLFLVIVSTLLFTTNAQTLSDAQLDSLDNLFVTIHNISDFEQSGDANILIEPHHKKCGFGLSNQIKLNIERFSPERQQLLKSYLQRPTRQTSMVSPSGFFKIHYNTSGSGVPSYNPSLSTEQNVMQVALALDSSYNFQVNFLGYPPPPPDNGAGGDDLYDVYIIEYGGSLYGETFTETNLGQNKYTSYMLIDNDYVGYYSTGLGGMRVTVAHEFHHGIQIGNYIFRDSDIFFYEITSTAMEEFVFDTINDYYAYMKDYFDNPDRAFANNNGYNLAAWNIYLRDKFGYGVLKRQWEMMPSMRALSAIHSSLVEASSSFREAYNEFGLWTFFTRYRAVPGSFFEEAVNYPLIKYTSTVPFNPASTPIQMNAKPTSNNFFAIVNSSINPTDTLAALITNSDYVNGTNNFLENFQFEYILAGDSIAGSTKLTDRYFVKINVDNPNMWSASEILNNHILRQGGNITPPVQTDEMYAYPNPFYYGKSQNFITIVLSEGSETEYNFNVYTSGMELVYSDVLNVSNKTLRWDIRNSVNEKLASGVYIYAVHSQNETFVGKLVIFNE